MLNQQVEAWFASNPLVSSLTLTHKNADGTEKLYVLSCCSSGPDGKADLPQLAEAHTSTLSRMEE